MNTNKSQKSVVLLGGLVVGLLSITTVQAQSESDFITLKKTRRVAPASTSPGRKGAGLATKLRAVKIIPLDPTLPATRPAPTDQGDTPSGKGEGTAQRGECQHVTQRHSTPFKLTPLSSSLIHKESSLFPILWFDLKYRDTQSPLPIVAEVSVEDATLDERLLPKTVQVVLPQQTGGFGLQLPHELERDRKYRWYLYLSCTATDGNPTQLQLEGELHSPQTKIHRGYQ